MKRVNYYFTGTLVMLMLAVSCVSPEEWSNKYEDIIPNPVSNVSVENVNGGAIIRYTLPSQKDLMGAKVMYKLTSDGEWMVRYASIANDTIVLEGYGDTNERTVTVYAIHENGNVSTGVSATIKPLTPPVNIMRETLQVSSTFGGIQVRWDNPLRKDMGVTLYVEDSTSHEMVLYDKYFSNSIDGKTTFRPLDPKTQRFRVEMFDRWQNYAQPMETVLTPLEEVEIMGRDTRGNAIWSLFDDGRVIEGDNTTPWRYIYRCDMHNVHEDNVVGPRVFSRTLDWTLTESDYWHPGVFQTQGMFVQGAGDGTLPYPLCFTVDMGRKAVYSRLKFISRQRSPLFSAALPVEFVIWGTNNPKTIEQVGDGSKEANQAYWTSWAIAKGTDAWKNDWVKLATCKLELSSGVNVYSEGMSLSSDDIARYQSLGWDFDFNLDVTEAYRYLRWEIQKTNTNQREIQMCAIKYWGSYED